MFSGAPMRTILPGNYLERRKRLQRFHADQAEERKEIFSVSPRIVKSLERCLGSLVKALPDKNLVIEDLIVRGECVEARYRAEEPVREATSEILAGGDAVTVTRVQVLRLDNGSVIEHLDAVYQVKTSPVD
jgi:SnoaL-like polyketide cyclase